MTSPIAYLAGATASGKSALAVEFAQRHGLAIISADALQVYRGLEIGTAQPTREERRGVPHHLIAVAEPAEEFHAARFAHEASRALEQEAALGRRCIVVGGTGLWMRALREGLFEAPGRDEGIRMELRAVLQERGAPGLHAMLAEVDALAAARLTVADHVRVLRALEVHRLTGRSIAEWQDDDARRRAALGPLPPMIVLDVAPEELKQRIARRVDAMLAAGWLDEARRLHGLDLPEHSPARKALGYRALFDVVDGRATIEAARERIVLATRQFARRQRTWFRRERDAQFLEPAAAATALEGLLA